METPEEAGARVREYLKTRPNPFAEMLKKQEAVRASLIEKYGADYDQPVRTHTVNKAEQAVINEWLESLKPEILALQKKQGYNDPLGTGEPYYGAVGGGVTYSFIGTGLGDILIVKEATTGKELNVTQALDWVFYG
jgi:hypothetical protein